MVLEKAEICNVPNMTLRLSIVQREFQSQETLGVLSESDYRSTQSLSDLCAMNTRKREQRDTGLSMSLNI